MADLKKCTDSEIFGLLKMGDMEAFDTIYDRYFISLLNAAFKRLRSREDAREVVQDVFVQLYMKREQIGHTQNLPAYLHTLLRNRIIDRFREELSRKKRHDRLKTIHPSVVNEEHEAEIDVKLLQEEVKGVIDGLPQKCREVFVLSRVNHLSHHAIAEKLKISVSTVEKHMGKALRIMRERIGTYQLSRAVVAGGMLITDLYACFHPAA
ncbi:RNA polymerase sigma-70 factor [Paraflavisolibacter sp. H34]|uniref:RNA polymerase sigma-70 factor n=1 Tax=Huijunlia imazamoxiresistens TaxID=3127457 RepID=UPI0030166575